MKKRIYIIFLVCALAMFPVRKADALLPFGIALYYAAGAGLQVSMPVVTALHLGAATIGATLGIIVLASNDGSMIAVPTTDDNPVPKPDAPQYADGVPYYSCSGYGGATGFGSTILDACHTNFTNTFQGKICPEYYPATGECFHDDSVSGTVGTYYSDTYCLSAGGCSGGVLYGQVHPDFSNQLRTKTVTYSQVGISCPAGYTDDNSGGCILYDADLVTQDNLQSFKRLNGAFSSTNGDLHGSLSAVPSTTNTADDTVSVSGIDSNNQPMIVDIISLPSGGTQINQSTQVTDGGGSSYVSNQTITLDDQGVITGGSSTATNETIQPLPDGSGYQLVPNDPSVIPADPVSTSGGSFPNDYASSSDVAGAASSINTSLAGLGGKLDQANGSLDGIEGTLTTTVDLEDPTVVDRPLQTVEASMLSLYSFRLPAHTSVCPSATFDLTDSLGQVFIMDQHCQIMIDNFQALQAAMMIAWTLLAMFIVLRA